MKKPFILDKCEYIPCKDVFKFIEPFGDGRLVKVCTKHRHLLNKQKKLNGNF